MGTFLKITYESRYAGDFENNVKQIKVARYIIDNLNNMMWQESISNQLQKIDKHHTSLSIILRLFDIKDIEEGKLKSYARYKKKEDKLIIDQMLVLNEYVNFQEDEMRIKLCDDIFIYLKEMLIKYKDRFQDFDAIAFITLLEEQIKKIKNNEFEDNFYETESYTMLKQAEEIKKNINNKLNS
ncbi:MULTISPECIES: hypothetical protein [unclassified Gilliamella]|uniref:hypothetical protein n=1 Tax=unclassified Gilliamella TaxID=2685620 RepID=UPI0019246E9E|nr:MULTISPECIES: hypothetical protein [unclassified Gilliamella]